MSLENEIPTSLTLLGRLRQSPHDVAAWSEFVDRYGVVVYQWCCKWGLQQADAEDVTQNVLLDLGRQMQSFEYRSDGRFRGFLRTIAHRSWCDFVTSRRRQTAGSGDSMIADILASVPVGDDLVEAVDAAGERELFELAQKMVRLRVDLQTWQAFERTAILGESGTEVSKQLKMPVASVYQAKSRVQKLLKDQVDQLDRGVA
jgi:RNA polymerase sigma factor (sigma-70 family)